MRLIAEQLGKSDKLDRLRFIRKDGSGTQCAMPHYGTPPHDLVHYVAESVFALENVILNLVAAGSDAGFVMQAVHDPANRTIDTEAFQTEAIVEALQTQPWGGTFNLESFLQAARLATIARNKPVFELAAIDPEELYRRAIFLLKQWGEVSFHKNLERSFVSGNGDD